jgi:hypothetical protein
VKKWDIVHVAHVPFTEEQLAERGEVFAEVNDPAYLANVVAAAAAAEMEVDEGEGPDDDGEAEADGEVDVTEDNDATRQENDSPPIKAS